MTIAVPDVGPTTKIVPLAAPTAAIQTFRATTADDALTSATVAGVIALAFPVRKETEVGQGLMTRHRHAARADGLLAPLGRPLILGPAVAKVLPTGLVPDLVENAVGASVATLPYVVPTAMAIRPVDGFQAKATSVPTAVVRLTSTDVALIAVAKALAARMGQARTFRFPVSSVLRIEAGLVVRKTRRAAAVPPFVAALEEVVAVPLRPVPVGRLVMRKAIPAATIDGGLLRPVPVGVLGPSAA